MKTRIAWHILFYNKRRAFAVVASVGFAILLMFLQLGLYDACEKNASLVYELLDFDAVLISPSYLFIDRTGTIRYRDYTRPKEFPVSKTQSRCTSGTLPFGMRAAESSEISLSWGRTVRNALGATAQSIRSSACCPKTRPR